jgi:hypothetical protein
MSFILPIGLVKSKGVLSYITVFVSLIIKFSKVGIAYTIVTG